MMNITILGGDDRQRHLAQCLREAGYRVRTRGLSAEPQDAFRHGDGLILPVPSFRGDYPRVPVEYGRAPSLEDICLMAQGQYVAGYMTDFEEDLLAGADHVEGVYNLAKDEIFLQDNAELTAEGALQMASGTDREALWQRHVMVLGFGRIGKALVRRLLAMDARVTLVARKLRDRTAAAQLGCQVVDYEGLDLGTVDYLFNTVPVPVLTEKKLQRAQPHLAMMELASAPYGIDTNGAQRLGLALRVEGGIPGRLYPQSAGRVIFEALRRNWLGDSGPSRQNEL